MIQKRVTIKEIAQKLDISPATVSLALSDNPLTNSLTREKVKRLASEMGYRPNMMARNLVKNRSYMVGTIIPDIATSFFPEVLQGIEDVIEEMNYTNLLSITYYNRDIQSTHIQSLLEKDIEGLLIVPAFESDNGNLSQILNDSNIPIISFINVDETINSNFVKVDHYRGGMEATNYLIQLGHERIGFISNETPKCWRFEGYLKALKDSGLTFDPAYCAGESYSWESGYEGALHLLRLPKPPTAIFASSDIAAMGVLAAARVCNIQVPGQLSVIGYDDLQIFQQLHINLTTITQPKKPIGEYAARNLFNLIEGRPVENILITPKLVIRETTAQNPERYSGTSCANISEWT